MTRTTTRPERQSCVRATCDTTNVPSARVLEKLGVQLERTIPHDATPERVA